MHVVFALLRFPYEEPKGDLPLHEVSVRGCLTGGCGHITHSSEEGELSPIPNVMEGQSLRPRRKTTSATSQKALKACSSRSAKKIAIALGCKEAM